MVDNIIIPPLVWIKDNIGEHYQWKKCADEGRHCFADNLEGCDECLMCGALTLPYEGDRSVELKKEVHHG